MKRRNFSAEFKRESAQLVPDQNSTVVDAASAMDVGLPEQFPITGKLGAHYPLTTFCHVSGVHCSSYKYWKNRPEKPDGRRAVLQSHVPALHNISYGSPGARSIATMETLRGFRMGRCLAGRPMKELVLVSCQQPSYRCKRGSDEHITIPNHLEWQSAVTKPFSGVVRRRDVYLDRQALDLPRRYSRPVCKETGGLGNVVLTGEQTDQQSAGNGRGNSR